MDLAQKWLEVKKSFRRTKVDQFHFPFSLIINFFHRFLFFVAAFYHGQQVLPHEAKNKNSVTDFSGNDSVRQRYWGESRSVKEKNFSHLKVKQRVLVYKSAHQISEVQIGSLMH